MSGCYLTADSDFPQRSASKMWLVALWSVLLTSCSSFLVPAGATGACAQREVPHPFLHVHRLWEPPQTLPGAQPVQAGYSRGEGGRRKCKYTSQFLTHSHSTSAPSENAIYPPPLQQNPPSPPLGSCIPSCIIFSDAHGVLFSVCAGPHSPPPFWCCNHE